MSAGAVRCWGSNVGGNLGYGSTESIGDDEAPATAGDVDVGDDVLSIQAGSTTTCALLPAARLRCWGAEMGIGDDETPAEAGSAADIHFW
jgi:hypothetical protein